MEGEGHATEGYQRDKALLNKPTVDGVGSELPRQTLC